MHGVLIVVFLATTFPSPASSVHGQSDVEEDADDTLIVNVTPGPVADNPASPFCPVSPVTFPHLSPLVVDDSFNINGNLCFEFLYETTSYDKMNDTLR